MAEQQRFQPVKGLNENIEKTAKAAGQFLIATDTGQMYLDINNQERISIGGSGVSVLYAEDPEPQKLSDTQFYINTAYLVDKPRVKESDLIVNIPEGALYKVINVSVSTLFCQRLSISGSGGGDNPSLPKLRFVKDIVSQLKGLYVLGEEFTLDVIPHADNDTAVTVTVSLYDETDTSALKTAYYEVKQTVDNDFNLQIELGTHFIIGSTRIDVKLESLNSGSIVNQFQKQQVVQLALEESPNFFTEKVGTKNQPLDFYCMPVGNIEKVLHLTINGQVDAQTKSIAADFQNNDLVVRLEKSLLVHGVNYIDAYLTATVNTKTIESNHLTYEVAYAEEGNNNPIIWFMRKPDSVVQYEDMIVEYMVYDPVIKESGTMTIEQLHDGLVVTTLENVQYSQTEGFVWNIADYQLGDNYYGISYKGITESFVINVTPSDRDMDYAYPETVIANLSANGRTNNESLLTRQKWQYTYNEDVYDCLLDNFNWYTNGWNTDENGRSYLKISDGASVRIPLKDPNVIKGIKLDGSGTQSYTFEFRLRIRNITNYDTLIKNITLYKLVNSPDYVSWDVLKEKADKLGVDPDTLIDVDPTFQSQIVKVSKEVATEKGICVSYLGESNNKVGFALGTQESYFGTGQEYVNAKYKEDEIFNISYVVSANANQALSKVYIYVNGLLTGITSITQVGSTRGFTIDTPYITINSKYCDVDLYNVRVYNQALDSWYIVKNYLADLRDVQTYDQNQISTNVNNLTVIDYQKLLSYNQTQTLNGKPEYLSMPYMVLQTVDNLGIGNTYTTDDGTKPSKKNSENVVIKDINDNNLPYAKGKVRYVKVSFRNPALDYAYDSGELEQVAKRNNIDVDKYYAYHCPSFDAYGGELNVQGTSSQAYPRRNYKLKLKNADYWRYTGGPNTALETRDITGSKGRVWCMDTDSDNVHNNKFTLKIDYMESSGSYNTGFANMVHYMYDKHPLDYYKEANPEAFFGIQDDMLRTYRTSVKGYPVLMFHAVKDPNTGALTYNYIGRYNMNLDKGSDDAYGYKYGGIKAPDPGTGELKTVEGSNKNPFVGKKGTTFKKAAECWEMRDNQGDYCSFKFPHEGQTSFKGYYLTSGILEATRSLEYRYNDDSDNLDVCYEFTEGAGKDKQRKTINSPLYQSEVAAIDKEIDAANSSIDGILAGDPELAAQLEAKQAELKAAETDEDKTRIEAEIKALEDDNGITHYRDIVKAKEKEKTDLGELPATKADFNSLLELRYSNIEKLYIWLNETNIDAVPYANEEELLYGNALQSYKDAISEAESYIIAIRMVNKKLDDDLKTLEQQLAQTTDEEQIANIKAQIKEKEDKAGITQYREIIKTNEDKIAEQIAAGPITDASIIAKYEFGEPHKVGSVSYKYDTKDYRQARFTNEFSKHLNEEYCLVYFIMTELLLCYDSRGKNLMMASWGPMEKGGEYIWFPIFYDIDTQLGINNTGIPTWDYDVDASLNAEAGAAVFSTSGSILWKNFAYCFLDKITEKYQEMRQGSYLNQDFIERAYRCDPTIFTTSYACKGVKPLVALNSDFEYKYILPTLEVGKGTNYGYIDTSGKWVQDSGGTFFYACQGDRDLSRQLLVRNRMNYLDSELKAGIYSESGGTGTTAIRMRATANTTGAQGTSDHFLDAELTESEKADGWVQSPLGENPLDCTPYLQVTPFLSQYVSVKYDQLKTTPEKYNQGDQPIYPTAKNHPELTALAAQYKYSPGGLGQQLIYILGAEYISKVDKLDNKYPSELTLSGAKRLTEFVLGQDNPDYFSNILLVLNLDDSVNSANPKPLLKKVVLTGIKNLDSKTSFIDVGASSKLEEFRALNTNITGSTIAIGCPISKYHLPSGVTSLVLNTNYNLTKAIRENLAGNSLLSTSGSVKGLYVEGLTDQIDETKSLDELVAAQGPGSFPLNRLEIRNDYLGYDSYQILKLAVAKKIAKTTPTSKPGLEIRMENVQWTPYRLLDTAAEIDAETTYYALNDHYQYVIIDSNDETFAEKRLNSLIYTKDESVDETQITSLEVIDKFIAAKKEAGSTSSPQFKDVTFDGNVPYLSGEIYVYNSEENPISELKIQEYNEYYPSLNIRVAHVEQNHTIKYVQIDDVSGVTKVYYVQKSSEAKGAMTDENNTRFANPNRNVTLVPSKNNYDFFGWSTDGTKEKVIISPKAEGSTDYLDNIWSNINFEEYEVDNVVTLYAAFELHKYNATFYNYDQSVLGTTQTEYSRINPINVINMLPSKPATDLDLTQVYGFVGWAMKSAPSRVLDMSTIHPIMDYEFIAVYEEKSVYDNVIDNSYLQFIRSGDNYEVQAANGVTLSGKITLPSTYNGQDIVAIRQGGFANQKRLTHVFFDVGTSNKITTVDADAFKGCSSLVYYETSHIVEGIVFNNGSFNTTDILNGMNEEQQKAFFYKVVSIGSNAFTRDFGKGPFDIYTLYLPAGLVTLGNNAFSNHKMLSKIVVGDANSPSRLETVGDRPFLGCALTSLNIRLTYYHAAGQYDKAKVLGDKISYGLDARVVCTPEYVIAPPQN